MELTAKELRIGNYVTVKQEIVSVYALGEYGISYDKGSGLYSHEKFDNRTIEPIPLTEDWLIKFGFVKQKTETGPPINAVWDEWVEQYEGLSITNDTNSHWFLCNYSFNQRHFKYVHQLQNVFLAITGEELKIKEDEKGN